MSTSLKEIEEQARALSAEDRAKIVRSSLKHCWNRYIGRFPTSRRLGQKRSNNASQRLIAERSPPIQQRMCSPMRAAYRDEAREIHRAGTA